MSPHVQEHPISRKDTHGTVLQFHLDASWGDEVSLTQDQVSAACLITVEVKIYETIDHLALACAHASHIDCHRSGGDSKLRRASRQLRNFGAVDNVLARKAGDIGARSANPCPLD